MTSTSDTAPAVAVVVLNWNGWQDTVECIASLLQTTYANCSIIVCDNNSHDGSLAKIKAWADDRGLTVAQAAACSVEPKQPTRNDADTDESAPPALSSTRPPRITLLQTGANLGYAGGNNVGIQHALSMNAEYIVLLNNDTVVAPDFLEPLVMHAAAGSLGRIVGPLICYAAEPERVWFAGARALPSLAFFQHRSLGRRRSTVGQRPIPTDYVTGCCIMFSAEAARTVGLLNDVYFAYFEDVDFCLRARQRGVQALCIPTSVIWHKESASTRKTITTGTTSAFKHYLLARNKILLAADHTHTPGFMLFLLINAATTAYYLVGFLARRQWRKMVLRVRGTVHGLQQISSDRRSRQPLHRSYEITQQL